MPTSFWTIIGVAALCTAIAVGARLWWMNWYIPESDLESPLKPAVRAYVRRRRGELQAERLGLIRDSLLLQLHLARLGLRRLTINAQIFLLKTPDFLTAFLLVIFRRRHQGDPPQKAD